MPRRSPPPALPHPAAGTDPATVRMQERFVETLAASTAATVRRPARPCAASARPAAAVGCPAIASAAPVPVVPTTALPARFRPLTTALVARRVRIAHGSASRAALRAVGRPAATFGNVVHLATRTGRVGGDHRAARPRARARRQRAGPAAVLRRARATTPRSTWPARSGGWPARPVPTRRRRAAVRRAAPPPSCRGSCSGSRRRRHRRPPPPGRRAAAAAPRRSPAAGQVVRRSAEAPDRPRLVEPAPRATRTRRTSRCPRRSTISRSCVQMLEQRILNDLERRGGPSRGGW